MGKGGGGGSQVIGYAYFLGLAYALCSKVDELLEFRLNGDTAAKPNLKGCGSFEAITGKEQPTHGSGNSKSRVYFYDGTQNTSDSYLTKQTGENIAYKNTAYFVINGFIGDNVRSAPNYSAVVKRTNLTGWNYVGVSDEINGDANPASVLWYMLTKLIGLDEKVLDKDSFLEANKTLLNEGLGISFIMSKPQEAKEWVQEILRTIDGALCINPATGRLTLRLLRDDYDQKNLKLINESNMNNLKFKRKAWDETYSRVTVKYTSRGSFSAASVSAINSATRQTLGFERAYSVEYMSISSAANANKVLTRLMRKLSYPLANLRFDLSSYEFKNLMVGDVLLFSNSALGVIDMPIRILNLGSDKEGSISVEACEDVFALKNITITSVQEDLYKPIDLRIDELEYFSAVESTVEMGDEMGVLPVVAKPGGFVQKIRVRDGLSGKSVDVKPFSVARLSQNFEISPEMGDEISFLVDEITPLWKVSATRAGWQRIKFTCLIDNEFINFQHREDLGDGKWRVKTLMRGLSGTKISRHLKGALVWFAPVDANDLITLPLVAPNTTLFFEASNFAVKSEIKKLEFSHSQNAKKPYPISNLKALRDGKKVVLEWKNRVRLHGANYRNADNIIAGVDEGLNENRVIIKWFVNEKEFVFETKGERFEAEVPLRTTFYLWQMAYKGGFLSDCEQITA
ncbi:phage tail protein [Campylobacter corcagiensis]|uniref:Tip attachment protein J domain-containing protein n=1 Tax=Campylobacter corcagiensis TaxID=1448857 RepID=A0A7M1LFE0_9BACT|nr:phage tail protein [Campylobacter corcagiensis]QKF64547.1 putative phage tail protein [Campylobacter corcagiensis]QOQ87278.1 hypothetical protein IMC76_08740 [Campylobacter corcagiensis]